MTYKSLYAALSDEQKKAADALLAEPPSSYAGERADPVRALSYVLDGADGLLCSGTEIRQHILREICSTAWGKGTSITVTVDNGAVDLEGVIFDERPRNAFRVAAENTPGVKEARDHVTWVESVTVLEACRVMRDRRIGAVVVTDEAGRVIGIFTGRDAVCRMLAEARDPCGTKLVEARVPTRCRPESTRSMRCV